MNKYINQITRWFALGSVAAGLTLSTSVGFAQEDEELEAFIVTGSLIPQSQTAFEAGALPVSLFSREDIDRTGFTSTAEILQDLNVNNGASVPISNNATGFTPAASSVSLRGLGPEATLVLIDGLRIAPYPTGTGGTTAFVDLNSIPLAAIESFEVLKDGASATYGADAVAGVVNLILTDEFVGANTRMQYGNTTNKDSSEFIMSGVVGSVTDTTSIVVGFNYYSRKSIFNKDRKYSEVPPFLSTNSSPLNVTLSQAAYDDSVGNTVDPTDTSTIEVTSGPSAADLTPLPGYEVGTVNNNGLVPAGDYTVVDPSLGKTFAGSHFNYNLTSGSYPEIKRYGAFMKFKHDIKGLDNLSLFGDALYQHTYSRSELAPSATGNFYDPGSQALIIPANTATPFIVPGSNRLNSDLTDVMQPTDANYDVERRILADKNAYNPFNPFNQDLSDTSRIRLWEFGNRIFRTYTNSGVATFGLSGKDIQDKWDFRSGLRYSFIEQTDRNNVASITNINRLLNQNDPIFDPDSNDYIGSTVAFNPFGYFLNPIENNDLIADFAKVETKGYAVSSVLMGFFQANTTTLLELPAGDVGFAFGADYRVEEVDQSPDALAQTGSLIGSSPRAITDASRDIWSVYMEANIPLVSPEQDVRGFYLVDLNIAGRYERFVTSGRDTFVPKVGIRVMPIKELMVRGSYGEGFREPSLFELFSGQSYGLSTVYNPLTDTNEREVSVSSTGNPNLAAEDTRSYNVGLVWTPQWEKVKGLTLGVDFWRLERDGTVSLSYERTVERFVDGELLPGESVLIDPANDTLVQVNSVFANAGRTRVTGIDFDVGYVLRTEAAGRFDFRIVATWLDKWLFASQPGSTLTNFVEEDSSIASQDGYLRWKANASLSWMYENHNATIRARYRDGFNDGKYADPANLDFASVFFEVKDRVMFDLQYQYTFFTESSDWFKDLKLTAGVRNVLDTDPPESNGFLASSTGYPDFLYSAEGRFWYLGVEKGF
jgi:outer membrane receptor protein involved in Fe transport